MGSADADGVEHPAVAQGDLDPEIGEVDQPRLRRDELTCGRGARGQDVAKRPLRSCLARTGCDDAASVAAVVAELVGGDASPCAEGQGWPGHGLTGSVRAQIARLDSTRKTSRSARRYRRQPPIFKARGPEPTRRVRSSGEGRPPWTSTHPSPSLRRRRQWATSAPAIVGRSLDPAREWTGSAVAPDVEPLELVHSNGYPDDGHRVAHHRTWSQRWPRSTGLVLRRRCCRRA